MPTKKKSTKAKRGPAAKTIVKGLFISRAMRRNAAADAASEVANRTLAATLAAEAAADAADLAKYEAQYPDQTDEEKAANVVKAQAQATADAHKKYRLK